MIESQTILIAENNDIKTAIGIITEELYATGYPLLPPYDECKNLDYLLIPLINTVWTLIKHRKKYVAEKREIDHNKMMLEQNVITLQKKISNLESTQKIMKTDVQRITNTLELTKISKDQILKELSDSKLMNHKMNKLLKTRNEDYNSRIRQKEHEILELETLLSQKIEVKRSFKNMDTSTNLVSSIGEDSILHLRLKQIEKMYKISICKLENTVRTLVQENINLRSSIDLFIKKLSQLQLILMKDNPPDFLDDDTDNLALLSKNNENYINDTKHLVNIPGDCIINLVDKYISKIISKIINQISLKNNL